MVRTIWPHASPPTFQTPSQLNSQTVIIPPAPTRAVNQPRPNAAQPEEYWFGTAADLGLSSPVSLVPQIFPRLDTIFAEGQRLC